eukprot:PRCOL_00005777-RA
MTGRASDEARVAAAAAAAVGDGGDCFVIPRKATRLFAYDWGAGSVSPFVPASPAAAEAALEACEPPPPRPALERCGADDVVLDLGAGDGTVAITAARAFGARAVGLELDAALVARATERAADAGVEKRVAFECTDIFAPGDGAAELCSDWERRGATIVTLFLLPAALKRLEAPLALWLSREDLADGRRRRVVSFGWPIDNIGAPVAECAGAETAAAWRVYATA